MISLGRASRIRRHRCLPTGVFERSGREPRLPSASSVLRSTGDRTAKRSREAVEEMSGDTRTDDKSGSDLKRHRAGNERDRLLLGGHRFHAFQLVLERCLAVDRIHLDHVGHLRFFRSAVGPGSRTDRYQRSAPLYA